MRLGDYPKRSEKRAELQIILLLSILFKSAKPVKSEDQAANDLGNPLSTLGMAC
jgi:hypothetical protein